MKCLIYQYWNGKLEPIAQESKKNIESYANKINVEYRFDYNQHYTKAISKYPNYYDAFRPFLDTDFEQYDKILFLDMDIFAVEGITENIFEETILDIGICEESHMPDLKTKINKSQPEIKWKDILKTEWDIEVPLNSNNLPRIFNSGVVLYDNSFFEKAKSFITFQEYIKVMEINRMNRFYSLDQNYLIAMIFNGVVNATIMPNKWNSQIHWQPNTKTDSNGMRPVVDMRDDNTQFVHVQLSGSSNWNYDKVWQVVNLPVKEWKGIG